VDIFKESEKVVNQQLVFAVTPQILKEIENLRIKASPSFEKELQFVEKILEHCVVLDEKICPRELVDDSILRIAVEKGYIVATTDSDLRNRLRGSNVQVLFLRQKNRLEFLGPMK
jgi:rRNA-processing protein FCF1